MKQKSSLFIIMIIASVFFNSCDEFLDEGGNNSPGLDCSDFELTGSTYAETEDLIQKVQDEYGSGYTIADWSDLKAIDDLGEWISCMGISDSQSFMVTKSGNFIYSSNRQYFVAYFKSGRAPSNWLVHASLDNKLFLGSWYGMNKRILAKEK